MRRTMLGLVLGSITVLAMGAGLSACTIGEVASQEKVSESTAMSTQPPAPPKANVADGATDVEPLEAIEVRSEVGLASVEMVNDAGKVVEAKLSEDKKTWKVAEPLGYGRTYTITARDTAGSSSTTAFTTVVPTSTTNVYVGPLDGSTVGVAQAISFRFDVPIRDTKAVEELIDVTTSNNTEGGFFWLDPYELRWRPKEFWQPGTSVQVSAELYGKGLGNGLYGNNDVEVSFTVGDEVKTVVDNADKMLRVYRNGEQINAFPIALGTDFKYDTPNGIYVVGDQHTSLVMDSRTFGLGLDSGGYVTPVDYATQLSYSGIYVHSAPWAEWGMGSVNQSHGCINASYANAKWFQETVKRGDPVLIKNTHGATLTGYDGLGYWNLDWEARSGGAKDPNA